MSRKILITTPGVYPDIGSADYFAEPCPEPALSNSGAKILLGGTAAEFAYAHPVLNPDGEAAKSDAAKRFGDVGHQLALGKGRGYAVGDYPTWASKEAKAFKEDAEARGLTPIKKADFAKAERAATVMRQRIEWTLSDIYGGPCPDYQTEVVFAWQEQTPIGPIWCRGMMDVWCPTLGVILDPKFTKQLRDGVFEAHASKMGWDMQDALYTRGMGALTGEVGKIRFINLCVHPDAPNVSRAREADEATTDSCRTELFRAIEIFTTCLRSNSWPGYPRAVEPWTAKTWTLNERMARFAYEDEDA